MLKSATFGKSHASKVALGSYGGAWYNEKSSRRFVTISQIFMELYVISSSTVMTFDRSYLLCSRQGVAGRYCAAFFIQFEIIIQCYVIFRVKFALLATLVVYDTNFKAANTQF